MAKKNVEEMILARLNEIADLNEENEGIKRESSTLKRLIKNTDRISSLITEVDELMAERDITTPISSRDGTFTAYKKRIGKSGVDMDAILQTGLFMWFAKNHPECLELNLKKAEMVTGLDLSAYAKRQAYDIYTVSKDEDYRYIAELLSDYHDEMAEKEAGYQG